MELVWTEDLSVGNASIDADHKVLLGLANGVVHAIITSDCSILTESFCLLDNKLRMHFTNKESIARKVGIPFLMHKQAQKYLLEELDFLKEELLARGGSLSRESSSHYSGTLKELILSHIVKHDMQMKRVLQGYPYDFSPGRG